jgi:hypothetical protein
MIVSSKPARATKEDPASYLKRKEKMNKGWAPVAHACNPSYSRGRNQDDGGSKPTQANNS